MPGRLAVYVDGFNLYHGVHSWSRCRNLWLDLEKLATSLRPLDTLVSLKYFTADVLNDPSGLSRQTTYQRALTAHSTCLEIVQGRYQSKQRECRRCGHKYTLYEEKETDVNIASCLVRDAARDHADTALVISADSDLIPAANAAKDIKPKLFVVFAFPPERHSQEIKSKFSSSFSIGKGRIRQAQLPQTVTDPVTGHPLPRPPKWQP